MSDHTTAIYRSNKMGRSHSMECHHQVLNGQFIHKDHLLAVHIPVAYKESQSNHADTEWIVQSKFLNLALEYLCFK